jgi:putative SOS response-associated peptidase YedK
LARLLDVDAVDTPELPIRWNVAPTQPVYALIADRRGARALSARRWGLVPHWSTDPRIGSRLINARGETAAQRPAFREAVRHRRTALVFDGFYEWRRPGRGERDPTQAFYFYPADGQPLVLAGLWDTWYDAERLPLRTCAIVTTTANATMAPIHHRMPVVLSREMWYDWLVPGPLPPSRLSELFRPAPDGLLSCHMVGTTVNSVRNEGPELVTPLRPLPGGAGTSSAIMAESYALFESELPGA